MILRPLTVSLLSFPVFAQNPAIDLTQWTAEHINGTGPWLINAPRLYTDYTNTTINDVSVLYGNFPVTTLAFRISVDPAGGDDDIIGFVLGWNPGDSASPTADYLLVDWKKATQAYQNWGTALEGLALSRVTGAFTRGYAGGPIDLWSHTGVCTPLMRGNTHGQRGWDFVTQYHFQVTFTPVSVDILLNGVPEFHATGTFNQGRFGCYSYSQSKMQFQFPAGGSFTLSGTGCQGSAGRPYLFSPLVPYVGESLPVIVANLPPLAPVFLVLGSSNTTWGALPLPMSLSSLGAPGCTAYVSGDVLLPVTNFNGTAYHSIAIPPNLLPSTVPLFFAQGVTFDPAANPLGIAVSNAAAASLGIR